MKIYKPKRRVCSGKSVRFDIAQFDPFEWLQVKSNTHVSFCIDGFIVTQNKNINGIFNKFEFEGNYNSVDELIDCLMVNHSDEILACATFAKTLNNPYRIFVWPKDYPTNYDVEEARILSINPMISNGKINLSEHKFINLKDLELGIKKLRGHSFSKVKSLLSANSNVECYLANHTENPWPGDLDALFYVTKENKTIALIEFKTHNKNTPIEKEFIGKYGNEDWRRFEVLYNLQNELYKLQGLKPKLLLIVWGTQDFENHKKIKIDLVENNKILATEYMDRPDFSRPSNELFNYIIDV